MATSVLIGNGINLIGNQDASWERVLRALVPESTLSHSALEYMQHKPLTLVYEEILLTQRSNNKRIDEAAMKKKIAELVDALQFNDFHRRVMESRIRNVITTNYDYSFEKSTGLPYPRKLSKRENKYSVFRRRAVGNKFVWHIHGEVEVPNTITLGYDQYSGYLQKLRTYATASREAESGSPFVAGVNEFDASDAANYSWLDLFLRDDIHIVGLGLGYAEIDLWWALTYKARKKAQGLPVGRTIYHDWYRNEVKDPALARRSLLRSLSVEIFDVNCTGGYEAAYDRFISQYLENVCD